MFLIFCETIILLILHTNELYPNLSWNGALEVDMLARVYTYRATLKNSALFEIIYGLSPLKEMIDFFNEIWGGWSLWRVDHLCYISSIIFNDIVGLMVVIISNSKKCTRILFFYYIFRLIFFLKWNFVKMTYSS